MAVVGIIEEINPLCAALQSRKRLQAASFFVKR